MKIRTVMANGGGQPNLNNVLIVMKKFDGRAAQGKQHKQYVSFKDVIFTKLKQVIEKLFCKHEWECLNHVVVNSEEDYFPVEHWVYKCKKCDKLAMTSSSPTEKRWFI